MTAPVGTTELARRAEGVELIGEMEGSGFKEPPALVRRSDGQVIQLPPLLYDLLARLDGTTSPDQIAQALSEGIGREVTPDNVSYLVAEKLAPLGVVTSPDGSQPQVAAADPLLGFKFRIGVVSERTSRLLGNTFRPLFLPPVVVAVLAGFVAADVWLFFRHGVAQALRQSLYNPSLLIPLFGAVVVSAAFHEIGHAAACRYGGGNPGKMGCGLYLAWPAFYTDVTDAYRLGRRARLRTDLGGVYFNVIIVLATVGVYLVTGWEPVLMLVLIQHFEIVHQLLPVVRLDGYYIVADLTGVPDLFARIGPILKSLVPAREPDERVTVLKRWVRVAVTAWVLVVVPLLLFQLLLLLVHLPRIVGTAWDSGVDQYRAASDAFGDGNWLGALSSILQLVLLAIPIVAILLMLQRLAISGARRAWTGTRGRPVARLLAVAAGAAFVAALLYAWIPRDNYEPIGPRERGTYGEAVSAVRQLPTRRAPLESQRRAEEQLEPTTTTTTVEDVTTTTTAVTEEREQTVTTVRRLTTTTQRGFEPPSPGNSIP